MAKTFKQFVKESKRSYGGGLDNAGGLEYDVRNSDGTIGPGYKPGKRQHSSTSYGHEIKPEPKHPLQGKKVAAKHENGQEVIGKLIHTTNQGSVAKIKHSSGMIHAVDAKTVKKA